MGDINFVALALGYIVLLMAAILLLVMAAALIFTFFPARWQFARNLPSHLDTPNGPFRLTLSAGVCSRWKARWFFGLWLMEAGEAPRSRVLTPKPFRRAGDA